jgi:hypothetical protein
VELSAIDHLATDKSIVICNGHGIHIAGVHVVDVANVGVEDVGVPDKRVVDVDSFNEATAAAELWEERLTKAQRKPANSNSETATKESHESRPVDWSAVNRPRAPTPSAVDVCPAAIVKWGETPG